MLLRLFDKWVLGRQRKELSAFIGGLAAMDGGEIGLVVAMAVDTKNRMVDFGSINLDSPILLVTRSPGIAFELSKRVAPLQKEGRLEEAAALMVWIHTLRASGRMELRSMGRKMWGELERGFPYVQQAAQDAHDVFGLNLDINGAGNFPEGLTPQPL